MAEEAKKPRGRPKKSTQLALQQEAPQNITTQDNIIGVLKGAGLPVSTIASAVGLSKVCTYEHLKRDNVKDLVETVAMHLVNQSVPKAACNIVDAVQRYEADVVDEAGNIVYKSQQSIQERELALKYSEKVLASVGVFKDNSGGTINNIVNQTTNIISPVVQEMLGFLSQRIIDIPDQEIVEGEYK